jgi:hypothetical protein
MLPPMVDRRQRKPDYLPDRNSYIVIGLYVRHISFILWQGVLLSQGSYLHDRVRSSHSRDNWRLLWA